MPNPILYVAITNHGFGHATRSAAVVAEIQRLWPEVVIILATTAPRWLLESYIPGEFILRPRGFDVGVVQRDSLTMDKATTLERWQEIRSRQPAIVASEAAYLKQNRVSLVLADIPPLAGAIAHTAGVPCWMMSNFGWDFIYREWGGEFVELADWIAGQFSQCDRLFRLPLHEPMSAFPSITDVGFTGGTPRYTVSGLRQALSLQAPIAQTVLMTFGGLGLERIPYETVQQFPDWQFLVFDPAAPTLPNLVNLTQSPLRYRPVDVMPACGRLVSKPGYSTFSEACRLGLPIATVTREDFAEAPVLLAGIQQVVPHQILDPADLVAGRWGFLQQDPQPPHQSNPVDTNGNQTIAEAVINFLQTA
jgi:hypothetical protein